jgi:hypothetical protein
MAHNALAIISDARIDPIINFIRENNIEEIRKLVTHPPEGLNINHYPNSIGSFTPLQNACHDLNFEIVRLLLTYPGIDVNVGQSRITSSTAGGGYAISRTISSRTEDTPLSIATRGTPWEWTEPGAELTNKLEERRNIIFALLDHPSIELENVNSCFQIAILNFSQRDLYGLQIIQRFLAFPGLDINYGGRLLDNVMMGGHQKTLIPLLVAHGGVNYLARGRNNRGLVARHLSSYPYTRMFPRGLTGIISNAAWRRRRAAVGARAAAVAAASLRSSGAAASLRSSGAATGGAGGGGVSSAGAGDAGAGAGNNAAHNNHTGGRHKRQTRNNRRRNQYRNTRRH